MSSVVTLEEFRNKSLTGKLARIHERIPMIILRNSQKKSGKTNNDEIHGDVNEGILEITT